MKNCIIYLLIIASLLFAFYSEEYFFRGFAILFGGGLFILGYWLESVIGEDVFVSFVSLGCLIPLVFMLTLGVGLHFIQKEKGKGIVVKSRFYTHDLEYGDSMVTRELRSGYSQFNGIVSVEDKETYYSLYNGNMCSIFSPFRKVMKIGSDYSLKQKDFGYGTLDYIKCGKDSFDLHGTQITDSYEASCLNYN